MRNNRNQLNLAFSWLMGLVLVSSILSACNKSYEEKKQEERASKEQLRREDSLALKIAVTPTLDGLPLFIGVEDSMFVKNGVDVHLKQRGGQIDCDTLIRGGYVEGFVSDLIRTERLKKEGIALRYVTATNSYWQLYTNRIARIKELKQLSDKMIAMARFSVTDYLADYAIDSARPKYDVYKIQITEPQATTARLYGNPMLMDSRDKNVHMGIIALREKALKDRRRQQQLKAFVKVYNMAVDSINKNGFLPYAAIISKYTSADLKTIKALPQLRFSHVTPPRAHDIAIAKRH